MGLSELPTPKRRQVSRCPLGVARQHSPGKSPIPPRVARRTPRKLKT
jgi:hypothetical protein